MLAASQGEQKFTFVEECKNPQSVTILTRAPNKYTLEQFKVRGLAPAGLVGWMPGGCRVSKTLAAVITASLAEILRVKVPSEMEVSGVFAYSFGEACYRERISREFHRAQG